MTLGHAVLVLAAASYSDLVTSQGFRRLLLSVMGL